MDYRKKKNAARGKNILKYDILFIIKKNPKFFGKNSKLVNQNPVSDGAVGLVGPSDASPPRNS